MRPILFCTMAVLMALATPAMAQHVTASSKSTSRSTSTGGTSTSNATGGRSSSKVINNITTADAASDPADPPGDPSDSTQTIRNTPELMAPSIVGGNPCTVGATAGVALPGFGVVGGGTWEGKGCERRQLAALLFNMGHDLDGAAKTQVTNAAIEVLCTNDDVRDALKRAGRPCLIDQPPVSVAVIVPPPPPAPAAVSGWKRPDWCDTASPAEQRVNRLACFGTPGRTDKPKS